ncbi:hypothetical protein A3Q56_00373 [Intoshia linei]|uniref:Uncharacterized protein n=1 Tax=Intoshia linei TaxID=1819745 RepID=A0A177BC97_9BILA|nr:hypothetical protein A3Q56_00373 [Intoshia linei]
MTLFNEVKPHIELSSYLIKRQQSSIFRDSTKFTCFDIKKSIIVLGTCNGSIIIYDYGLDSKKEININIPYDTIILISMFARDIFAIATNKGRIFLFVIQSSVIDAQCAFMYYPIILKKRFEEITCFGWGLSQDFLFIGTKSGNVNIVKFNLVRHSVVLSESVNICESKIISIHHCKNLMKSIVCIFTCYATILLNVVTAQILIKIKLEFETSHVAYMVNLKFENLNFVKLKKDFNGSSYCTNENKNNLTGDKESEVFVISDKNCQFYILVFGENLSKDVTLQYSIDFNIVEDSKISAYLIKIDINAQYDIKNVSESVLLKTTPIFQSFTERNLNQGYMCSVGNQFIVTNISNDFHVYDLTQNFKLVEICRFIGNPILFKMDKNYLFVMLNHSSDQEPAMTKSIYHNFIESKLLLCSRHVQNNVIDYLKNCGVDKKLRSEILHNIFDENIGLAHVDNDDVFEGRNVLIQNFVEEHCLQFLKYFIDKTLSILKEFIGKINHSLWTNNNCESLNNKLKMALDYKKIFIRLEFRIKNVESYDVKLYEILNEKPLYQKTNRIKHLPPSIKCQYEPNEMYAIIDEKNFKKTIERANKIIKNDTSKILFSRRKVKKVTRKLKELGRKQSCKKKFHVTNSTLNFYFVYKLIYKTSRVYFSFLNHFINFQFSFNLPDNRIFEKECNIFIFNEIVFLKFYMYENVYQSIFLYSKCSNKNLQEFKSFMKVDVLKLTNDTIDSIDEIVEDENGYIFGKFPLPPVNLNIVDVEKFKFHVNLSESSFDTNQSMTLTSTKSKSLTNLNCHSKKSSDSPDNEMFFIENYYKPHIKFANTQESKSMVEYSSSKGNLQFLRNKKERSLSHSQLSCDEVFSSSDNTECLYTLDNENLNIQESYFFNKDNYSSFWNIQRLKHKYHFIITSLYNFYFISYDEHELMWSFIEKYKSQRKTYFMHEIADYISVSRNGKNIWIIVENNLYSYAFKKRLKLIKKDVRYCFVDNKIGWFITLNNDIYVLKQFKNKNSDLNYILVTCPFKIRTISHYNNICVATTFDTPYIIVRTKISTESPEGKGWLLVDSPENIPSRRIIIYKNIIFVFTKKNTLYFSINLNNFYTNLWYQVHISEICRVCQIENSKIYKLEMFISFDKFWIFCTNSKYLFWNQCITGMTLKECKIGGIYYMKIVSGSNKICNDNFIMKQKNNVILLDLSGSVYSIHCLKNGNFENGLLCIDQCENLVWILQCNEEKANEIFCCDLSLENSEWIFVKYDVKDKLDNITPIDICCSKKFVCILDEKNCMYAIYIEMFDIKEKSNLIHDTAIDSETTSTNSISNIFNLKKKLKWISCTPFVDKNSNFKEKLIKICLNIDGTLLVGLTNEGNVYFQIPKNFRNLIKGNWTRLQLTDKFVQITAGSDKVFVLTLDHTIYDLTGMILRNESQNFTFKHNFKNISNIFASDKDELYASSIDGKFYKLVKKSVHSFL